MNQKYDCLNCCYKDKTVNFCCCCMKKILAEFYEEREEMNYGKEYEQQCNQGSEQGV